MSGSQHLQPWQGSGWDPDRNLAFREHSIPLFPRRESSSGGLKSAFGQLRRLSTPNPSKHYEVVENVKGSIGLTLLHEPSEPRIDFVFVHGLGGGSRKTWSLSEDIATFWPKEWLPYEYGFKNVRIHSFGYDSDWTSQKTSSLTVHDFGQALLADLSNSPHLKINPHTPIVLVAHSMGGLVVKKAYLLATRDPLYKGIASRIHSLYFLATPHRGADSAQLLSNLLSLKGSKAFVKDLIPGSGSLQAINDEFRHVCSDVQLWSFFEGVPTSGGISSVTVVEKESAVLDLPGERKRYLPADHRHICKFTSTEDPNYITLRSCFRTTIDEVGRSFASQREENYRAQMSVISNAFDNAKRPEADLAAILDKQHDGSCLWLTEHDQFHLWLGGNTEQEDLAPDTVDGGSNNNRVLWINGPPGTGKSVLSGHVIKYLDGYNSVDCAYFFFKRSSKPTLSQLLLSLALQMAETNFEVRKTFSTMIESGEGLNSQDHTVIWNSLFLGHLLKVKFAQQQVWVIDALDECPSRQLGALIHIFAKIDRSIPLKILVTSRPSDQIERLLDQERVEYLELHAGQRESLGDISTYVKSKLSRTHGQGLGNENNDIANEILDKSNGVFLWASLILARLEDAHTVESMREVLSQVPSEMNGLYRRILESVEQSSSASLAHCILKWVVCSPQPLSTEELKEAVRLDINQTLRTSDRIPHICGNLVTVDNASRVQLMHRTVKDFLTTSQSGNFIKRHQAHMQLASRCLERLNETQFTPQRARRQTASTPAAVSTFDDYALAHFSHHLAHCSTSTDEDADLLSLLASFMNGNFLTWIERTARSGRLSPFKRAIENLRIYLNRYSNDHSPLEPEHQMVSVLVDDFARVLAIFGPNLVDTPSSIYGLIPIICPSTSLFHQKYGNQTRQRLISSANEFWDERLSCLLFPARALCITCNDRYVAVGLRNGTIRMHRASTFELVATIQHGEPIRRLLLSTISNILVTSSPRKLVLWDEKQNLKWSVPLSVLPLSLSFSSDESKIYVAIRTGVVLSYRVEDGQELDPLYILDDSSDSDSDSSTRIRKGASAELVRLCPELDIVGVSFRYSHLNLCYIESDEKIGVFEKMGYEGQSVAPQILDIAFSPLKDLNLAAVAYQDGEIVTFNIFTLQQKAVYPLYCHILASSPDGRTLCAGDNDGVIRLFTFDTLRPIYQISTLEEHISGIAFASNSARFFDIRGNGCNVWEPSVLIRVNVSDDSSSEAEEHNLPIQEAKYTRHFEDGKSITVLTQAGNSNYIFCGREDGTITYHDLRSGRQVEELRYHARTVEIQHLDWHAKTQTLFSVDASGRCVANRFSASSSGQLQRVAQIFDHRAASAVKQAVVNSNASAFLISTNGGEELWDNSNQDSFFATSTNSSPFAQWLVHANDPSRLILVDGDKVNVFLWKDLTKVTHHSSSSKGLLVGWPSISSTSVWFCRGGLSNISTIDRDSTTGAATLLSLDIPLSEESPDEPKLSCTVIQSMPEIKVFLGTYRSDLYFLSRQGWICSMKTKTLPSPKSYTRHFFIPSFWQIGNEFVGKILSTKSVAFAYRDEIIIFHAFLEFEDKVALLDTTP